jgi:diaminopimelate epimerase
VSAGWTFLKGHGTGNDFVLLPDPAGERSLSPALVAALCDRHTGVGADGVLRVVPATAGEPGGPRWFMDYRNADGSVAEMCGNGLRVFARYLVDAGLESPGRFEVGTRDGARRVEVRPDGEVSVDMGVATFPGPEDVKVRTADGTGSWSGVAVGMGNPHVVVFVDDLAEPGSLLDPPEVTPAAAFADGVNVEFVLDRGPGALALRVYERGVGETLSCGTGACAAFAAALRRHEAPGGEWAVDVPGGRLRLRLRDDQGIELTGPAEIVASGSLDPGWLRTHGAAG